MITDRRFATRVEAILVVGLLVCSLPLFLYHLEIYPAPWFDEGLNFQVAKNVTLRGQYGLQSGEGLVSFHPAIQTGPTVLLPMALVFRVVGLGIFQARMVTIIYAVLALVVFYLLARKTSGRRTAFLALFFLLFTFDSEFTSFVFMGRQVLGEVPALAFFWLGTFLWFRAWKGTRPLALVWSGLLWGLTLLTKGQFLVTLPTALFSFWLLDRVTIRQLRIRHVLVPLLVGGGCVLMWYGCQAFSLGFFDFWQQTLALGSAGKSHFLNPSPRRMLGAISQLSGSTLLVFGVPGMLHTLGSSWRCRRTMGGYQQVFLVVFTVVWLGWYAFLSIGWMRYAFVPAAMSAIFAARLLVDLWDQALQRDWGITQWLPLTPSQVAIGGVILMLLLSGLIPLIKQTIRSPDTGLQEMAQYLNTHVPADVVIESWEWEMDLLTDRAFHHPPYEVTNAYTERIWYGSPIPPGIYDPLAFHPDYLIVGPFAQWTGVYAPSFLEECCTQVVAIEDYVLHQVRHPDPSAYPSPTGLPRR